jgi:hypothetical protein
MSTPQKLDEITLAHFLEKGTLLFHELRWRDDLIFRKKLFHLYKPH